MKLTETVQTADWKAEKHVPVIHVERADGLLKIKAVSYTHLTLPTN